MKRFWRQAAVVARDHGFGVVLDGKPVNLPGGGPLVLVNAVLAAAVAAEWGAAGARFGPDDLPLTRLAATTRERVPARRGEIIGQLAEYGMNDLLCYRAADNEPLAAAEAAAWDVWLSWAAAHHGAVLRVGAGLAPVAQPPATRAAFTRALASLPDADLAGLGVIVPALGSLVLGLGLAAGALAPAAACALAELDALWQEGRWGADDEARARRHAIAADIAVSAEFMILSRA